MARSKLTSKGQTTLPMLVRERLGLQQGDAIDFVFLADGSVALRSVKHGLLSLEGSLSRPEGTAVSLGEMDEAIRRTAVKRYARSGASSRPAKAPRQKPGTARRT